MNFRFAALLIFLTMFTLSATARADTMTDIVQVQCMPELNLLTINVDNFYGDVPLYALSANATEIKKKYGILALTYYKGYVHGLSEDKGREFFKDLKPAPENLVVVDIDSNKQYTNKTSFECVLKTEDNPNSTKIQTYKITLEGAIAGPHPQYSCGAWRTFTVTIETPTDILLDKIPFQPYCDDPDWEKTAIFRMTLNPNEGYVAVSSFSDKVTPTLWIDNAYYPEDRKYPYHYKDVYLDKPER